MSSLKESLIARRTESSRSAPSTPSAQFQVPNLIVEESTGHDWIFPWAHFAFAEHSESGDCESLVLNFVSHQVQIRGVRLVPLMEIIAGLRLERLTTVPSKYRNQVPEGESCVEDISVRASMGSGGQGKE